MTLRNMAPVTILMAMACNGDRDMETTARKRGFGVDGALGFDAGLRDHMLRVYNIMAAGVALTGVVAWLVASMAVSDGVPTPFGQALFGGPAMWIIMLAPLGISLFLSVRAASMSSGALLVVYLAYAVSLGLALGPLLMAYTGASIAKVFLITASSFGALSLWGYVAGRDLSGFGSFLIMGMFGLIIAALANLFLMSGMLDFVISVIGVGIFAGMTAYDTQRIKEIYDEGHDDESVSKLAILGAFSLYTDFVGMFVHLMNLLGSRE